MLITKKLPDKIKAFDKSFEIITNARFWINITLGYEKVKGDKAAEVSLFLSSLKEKDLFYKLNAKYKKRLFERILYFFSPDIFRSNDREINEDKTESGKLYDFEKDGADILSAFQEAYKIDLSTELDTMHWWRFLALFNCLPATTHFVSYKLHYRRLKTSDNEYKNLSPEGKSAVDKIKKYVSLESEIDYENYALQTEKSIFEKIKNNTNIII